MDRHSNLPPVHRREWLKVCAGALLSAGHWPGQLRAEDPGKGESGWSFIAVNDLHYRDPACGGWFEKVVVAMKASAPNAEFCLLGGDQANDGRLQQLGPVREIFSALGVPL